MGVDANFAFGLIVSCARLQESATLQARPALYSYGQIVKFSAITKEIVLIIKNTRKVLSWLDGWPVGVKGCIFMNEIKHQELSCQGNISRPQGDTLLRISF